MGIGAAFAMGLVKGFRENIDAEKQRRLGEQEKLDGIEEMALKSLLEGKATKKGYSAVSDLIKSAQQKIDDRPKIDIFGRATDGIDLDLAKAQTAIQKAGSYESLIGSGDYEFGFGVDVRKFGTGDSNAAIAEMNSRLFTDPVALQKLAKAPDGVIKEIENIYGGHAAFIMNNYNANKQAGNTVQMNMSMFGPAQEFDRVMRLRNKDPNYSILSRAYAQSTGKPAAVDPGNFGNVITMSGMGDNQFGYASLGMSLRTDINALPNVWAQYTSQAGGRSKDERQMYFDAARDIAQDYGKRGLVFPTKNVAINTMRPQDAKELLQAVSNKVNNDPIGMAYVFGAFQHLDNWNPDTGFEYVDEAITTKLYAAKTIFGREAKEEDFDKLVTLDQELTDTLGSEAQQTGLYGLKAMVEKDFVGPPGLDMIKGKLASAGAIFTALVGDESPNLQKADVADLAPNSEIVNAAEAQRRSAEVDDNGDPVEFLTTEYISGLNNRIEQARITGMNSKPKQGETIAEAGARYARFEAIRIALAFQMARAADPSGRLSNQDIEAQLVRLGKNFDTVKSMKARLEVAIKDFEVKKQRYGAIIEIAGDATSKATVGSKKLIRGVYAVDRLAKKAGYLSYANYLDVAAPVTAYAPPQPNQLSSSAVAEDGSAVYIAIGEDGNPVKQDGQNVYVDKDGAVVENIKPLTADSLRSSNQTQTPVTAPATTQAPAAPAAETVTAPEQQQGVVTAPEPEANAEVQSDNGTAGDQSQPAGPRIVQGLNPELVTVIDGNNLSGLTLQDKETGETLPGLYIVKNGRYVKKPGTGA